MSKIRDLENAIKTLENVSNPENAKKAFDIAKENLLQEFEEEKDNIKKLSIDNLIAIQVAIIGSKIEISVKRIPSKKDALYTVTFEGNKINLKNETCNHVGTRINITFKQAYDYHGKEFVFVDDTNKRFDIFESVMKKISGEILTEISKESKSYITIIQ